MAEARRPRSSVNISVLPKLTTKLASLMQLQLELHPTYLCMIPIHFSISCMQVLDRSLALVALAQSSQKRQTKCENVGAGGNFLKSRLLIFQALILPVLPDSSCFISR